MELTRINNDTYGNPRYVVHFLEFLNESDHAKALKDNLPLTLTESKYIIALKKAKTIGGKKFHNKQYGGGIVFQSYNTDELIKQIKQLQQA